MRKEKWFSIRNVCALFAMAVLLGACGAGGDPGSATPSSPQTSEEASGKENEKIENEIKVTEEDTLSFYNNIGVPDSYYDDYIEPHVKRKFPHVTLEYMNSSAEGNAMRDLVVAQKIPDIILTTNGGMANYIEMEAIQPLDPLIKRNDLDISIFRQDMIEALRKYDPDGQLYALPWTYGTYALFYNKEIFDRFGVEYPRDGMYWDDPELRSMVERLSRTEDGVQYRGLEINLGIISINPLSLPWVDAETETAAVNTDQWKNFLQTFLNFYEIKGNEKPQNATFDSRAAFIEERNIAMWVGNAVYPQLIGLEKEGNGFDWDIVSLPSFREATKKSVQYQGALFNLSSATQHPDSAMQVITHLTSKEVQIEGGTLLRYPTLNDPEVQAAFGKGESFLERKNMQALHINDIAPSPVLTKYDAVTRGILNEKVHAIMRGQLDINTALREAEELMNQRIAEEKANTQ